MQPIAKKSRQMLKRSLSTFIFTLALASTGEGFANPRGIIYSEGKKPARTVYVAEFLDVYDRSSGLGAAVNAQSDAEFQQSLKQQKQVEMRVIAVYENKASPESTDMTVEFQCYQKQYRITMSHAMLRDGSEQFPTQDWRPYATAQSAWPSAAAAVACAQDRIKKAVNEVATSKNGQDFSALDKLGILYIGEPDRLETVDKVWQTVLSDGSRPKYADRTLSDEEAKAYHHKIDASLAQAKEDLAKRTAMAQGELSNMQEERKLKNEIAKNAKKHGKQLKWILGLTESEIIHNAGMPKGAFFAAPSSGKSATDARYLTYLNQYTIDGVGYTLDANGNHVGTSTQVTCEIQIELRQGGTRKTEYRVVDYRLFADNGGCRDLSWFNKAAK